jgi:hypothetical protein
VPAVAAFSEFAVPAGIPAPAQQPDAAQTEQMMKKVQEMQACLQKVIPQAMETLQARAKTVGEEQLQALCAAGERDAALQRALADSRQMADAHDLRALSACGDLAKDLMTGLPPPSGAATAENNDGCGHVCDSLR